MCGKWRFRDENATLTAVFTITDRPTTGGYVQVRSIRQANIDAAHLIGDINSLHPAWRSVREATQVASQKTFAGLPMLWWRRERRELFYE